MAGWKTEAIYDAMPSMLALAAGSGSDLARVADITSDNLTAMGLSSKDAVRMANVYSYAMANANVNLEGLGETMKYAAPVAASFGATLEDTVAMTMMMGNAGIKNSMAGTALRMGLLRLAGPPKKASKAMEEMGLSMSDATAMAMETQAMLDSLGINVSDCADPMEKMGSIITQLSGKMANMTQEEKLSTVSAIFGANAASGWINIIEQGPKAFYKYRDALRNSDGYADQFAKTMNDDTRGALIALDSAMDAVVNNIGTALLAAVRSVAEGVTPLVSAFAGFIQAHPAVVQAAAAIAAAIATIIVGAAGVQLAFAGWGFVTSAVALVQTSLAGLASGSVFPTLIARLTAVKTAMMSMATTGGWSTLLGTQLKSIKTAMTELAAANWSTAISNQFTLIKTQAATSAASVKKFFASLTASSVASSVTGTLSKVGTALAGVGKAAMSFAFSPIGVALMALGLAGYYAYTHWSQLAPVFSQVASIITTSLNGAIETVMPAIRNLSRAFDILKPALESAFSGLADSGVLSTIGSTLVEGIAMAAAAIAGVAATIITAFANVVTTVTQMLTLITGAIRNVFEGNFSGAADKIVNVFKTAVEGIKNLFTGLGESITGIFDNIAKVRDVFNFSSEMPTADAVSRHRAELPAQSTPAPETPPIDTSATQAALDGVGISAQQAAANMDGVNQATQSLTQAGADTQTFSSAVQQAGAGVQTFTQNAQTAGSGVQSLGQSAQTSTAGIEALSSAASGATGGIEALSSAAGGAAGAVSGLGSAASAACSALAQAGANAAAAVSAAASSAGAKSNYKGGIYPKGEFLTTFAEKSPEAAIPIDNSDRARELWERTGQLLGTLPGKSAYDSAPKDEFGNLADVPDFLKVDETDDRRVTRWKLDAQREQFEARQLTNSLVSEAMAAYDAAQNQAELVQEAQISQSAQAVQSAQIAQTQQPDVPEFDEFGNIKNMEIDEFNRITDYDSRQFARSKSLAQLKKWHELHDPKPESVTSATPPELPTVAEVTEEVADKIPDVAPATTPDVKSPESAAFSMPSLPDIGSLISSVTSKIPDVTNILGNVTNQIPSIGGLIGSVTSKLPSIGGLGDGLLSGLTGGLSPQQPAESSTFNVTINVTANGSDENSIRDGVESAIPALDDWATQFLDYQHEQARRSFA